MVTALETREIAAPATDKELEKSYQEMPYNIEAEQALLGAMLVDNTAMNHVGDFLQASHFYQPVHMRIFEAIQKYVDKGMIANPVTLKPYFDKDEALAAVGGATYLARIATMAGAIFDVKHYGMTVFDLALKRELIHVGKEIVTTAFSPDIDLPGNAQIELAEQKLFILASSGTGEKSVESLGDAVATSLRLTEAAWKNDGKVNGVTTGFRDMDRLLGGLQNSDLVILAGRPSMGKTALATTMAFKACESLMKEGKEGSVAFFSLEMSSEQLAGRLLSSASHINSSSLRRGKLSSDEFEQLVQASRALSTMPFFIDDTPAVSISALRTRARRLKRTHKLSLLIVDYLQLMRGSSKNGDNRVQEISEITQGLKAVAKELNIPVIALSQLSRQVEQRDDKRPQLSDLRESGSIEQDADVVMFVYREEYYLSRKQPKEGTEAHLRWQSEMEQSLGIADVIIAKQRHGPIGTVQLQFTPNTAGFGDLERHEYGEVNAL